MGLFAANFHAKDAARFLVSLANLRGGEDNITVVLAQDRPVGRAPESAQDIPRPHSSENGAGRGGFLKRLFGRRKPEPEPIEEHIYRTAQCPVTDAQVETFLDQVRRVQATAIERTWPVDWTMLTAYRRQADEARVPLASSRSALRALGRGDRPARHRRPGP